MTKKKIILWFILSLLIGGMGYAMYRLNNALVEKRKKINEMEKSSKHANADYYKLKFTKDSLLQVNAFLSKYKTLTMAMTYRDSVRSPLSHHIGDVVYLKYDSSRVIISDIIVGGGNYEYYIKYKVLLKDGQEKEVVPEMIL